MPARESFFACHYTSLHHQRTVHVRAWNEKEAAQLVREELLEEGLTEPGKIEVVCTRGHQRLEARFDPVAQP